MKRFGLALGGLVLAAAGAIIWSATRPVNTPAPSTPSTRPTAVPSAGALIEPRSIELTAPGNQKLEPAPPASALLIADPQAATEHVQGLIAAAGPGTVPKLTPYLEHPDRGVRLETVTALLLLGEPGAAPALHAAAGKAKLAGDEAEADNMHEATEFLTKPALLGPPLTPGGESKSLEIREAPRLNVWPENPTKARPEAGATPAS